MGFPDAVQTCPRDWVLSFSHAQPSSDGLSRQVPDAYRCSRNCTSCEAFAALAFEALAFAAPLAALFAFPLAVLVAAPLAVLGSTPQFEASARARSTGSREPFRGR